MDGDSEQFRVILFRNSRSQKTAVLAQPLEPDTCDYVASGPIRVGTSHATFPYFRSDSCPMEVKQGLCAMHRAAWSTAHDLPREHLPLSLPHKDEAACRQTARPYSSLALGYHDVQVDQVEMLSTGGIEVKCNRGLQIRR
nr:hypothetical protein CFP56_21778 [Quercus suber]